MLGSRCSLQVCTVQVQFPSMDKYGALEEWIWDWSLWDGQSFSEVSAIRGSTYGFTVMKGKNAFVLVYPVHQKTGIRLKPAGAVWQPENPQDVCTAEFRFGFAVTVLQTCSKAGIDLSKLNIRRFLEQSLSTDAHSPWFLDSASLVQDLRMDSLSVYSFKEKQFFNVTLQVPKGLWKSADPLLPDLEAGDGVQCLVLTEGFHSFFLADFSLQAHCFVDTAGSGVWMLF